MEKENIFRKSIEKQLKRKYSNSEYLWRNFAEELWHELWAKTENSENKLRETEKEKNEMIQLIKYEQKEYMNLKQLFLEQAKNKTDKICDELQSYKDKVFFKFYFFIK